MRATSFLVFICYFVLPSVNKDFTYSLTYLILGVGGLIVSAWVCITNVKLS